MLLLLDIRSSYKATHTQKSAQRGPIVVKASEVQSAREQSLLDRETQLLSNMRISAEMSRRVALSAALSTFTIVTPVLPAFGISATTMTGKTKPELGGKPVFRWGSILKDADCKSSAC